MKKTKVERIETVDLSEYIKKYRPCPGMVERADVQRPGCCTKVTEMGHTIRCTDSFRNSCKGCYGTRS